MFGNSKATVLQVRPGLHFSASSILAYIYYLYDSRTWLGRDPKHKSVAIFKSVMSNGVKVETEVAPSIDVKALSYAFPDGSSGLKNVILNLPPGSRTLLIGGINTPRSYHP